MPAAATEAPAATAAATARPPRATPAPAASSKETTIVVLDAEPIWDGESRDGRRVVTVAPGDDVASRIAELMPDRIVVNLVPPKMLGTLVTLRRAGCTAPFWACLADVAAGRGVAVGMVEVAARPLDPDAVLASLGALAARGTRLVTIGDDVEGLVSLRHTLVRVGMAVSMGWDAKHAADLVPMVRPAAVVIDLDLPGGEGYGVFAQLSTVTPVPMAVLIESSKPGKGFAPALSSPGLPLVALPRLLSLMHSAGDRSSKGGAAGPARDRR
jgi:DNA-binding response OmpR family regulator